MKLIKFILFFVIVIVYASCQQPYQVKSFDGENISINKALQADSFMLADIAPYRIQLDAKMNKIIGQSEKQMLAYQPESPLSNFISDIIQNKVHRYLVKNDADTLPLLALMNIKGIRSPIPKGEVSVRNIFELMPFENEIVVLTLRGDSVLSLFNFLGLTNGDGIAGASAKYDGTSVTEVLINDKPINLSQNYFLATSDYLADGGDHYQMIMQPIHRKHIGLKLREAIMQSVEEKSNSGIALSAQVEGRIIFN